jgi:large subunit ribosomal protein L6
MRAVGRASLVADGRHPARAVANMVKACQGFERKLELVGVGYRAAMQGKDLNLTLGFSHPVVFKVPRKASRSRRRRRPKS